MTCRHCFGEAPAEGPCPRCGHDSGRQPWRPPALAPGTELGGEYRLGRVLGKGGFGITYVALDVNLERRVAVKEFFPAAVAARGPDQTSVVATDEGLFGDWRQRFLDEARTLAWLEHANVVRVLRFFEAAGTAYMVMEFCEGESLAERLNRGGRMTPAEAVAVMGPILEALEAVHGLQPRPLIHRDVKPANIFLLAGGRPVLLDFGAARHASLGDDPKSLSVILTPGFAPYEQYSRTGAQGPWTDVYGAAATVCRMVTGETPPDAVDRMVEDRLRPLHETVPSIGPAFSQAVLRGLAVKPPDRPATARAFRSLLLAALQEDGRTGSADTVVVQAPTVVRPRTGVAPAAPPAVPPPRSATPPQPVAPAPDRPVPPPVPGPALRAPQAGVPVPAPPARVPPVAAVPAGRQQPPRKVGLVWLMALLVLAGTVVAIVFLIESANRKELAPAAAGSGAAASALPGAKFVRIPAGRFSMGSSAPASFDEEKPVHEVSLTRPFELQTTEVTQAQWRAVMGNNPSKFPEDDRPVEQVSWNDCQTFLRKLNEREPGRHYRLPTEAEWEYACRAGSAAERYGELGDTAWYARNAGGATHPVGQKRPNAWGLFDMLGNVWEWCADWYDDYPAVAVTDPPGPPSGSYRVIRGGGWNQDDRGVRATNRGNGGPNGAGADWGFRLARDPAP